MFSINSLSDLQKLIETKEPESSTLEYKRSASLDMTSPSRNEMSKDISAMANAESGQIIYGMEEKGNRPTRLDDGLDATKLTRERLEQIIHQIIKPMVNVKIKPIAADDAGSRCYYVVNVPPPDHSAPYQANDNKYYRRRNFRADPMEDYEVREVFTRVQRPDLYLDVFVGPKNATRAPWIPVDIATGDRLPRTVAGLQFRLYCVLGNRTHEPCLYSLIKLYLEEDLRLVSRSDIPYLRRLSIEGINYHSLERHFAAPEAFPVFQGSNLIISQGPVVVELHRTQLFQKTSYRFGYTAIGPGCFTTKQGEFRFLESNEVEVVF